MALFSRDGRQIYVAQARGLLSVLERASRLFLDALRVRAHANPKFYKIHSNSLPTEENTSPKVKRKNSVSSCALQLTMFRRVLECVGPAGHCPGMEAGET